MVQVRTFLSPSVLTLASVCTSSTAGIVSTIVIESTPTNDSTSITTSKAFGLTVGSILLCAVLTISNSKYSATSNVVLKLVSTPSACE